MQLLLRDGAVEQVKAISKPKNSHTHRHWASRGYLTRGQMVVDAHRDSAAARTPRGLPTPRD